MDLVEESPSIGFEWTENDKLLRRRYLVYHLLPHSLTHPLSLREEIEPREASILGRPFALMVCCGHNTDFNTTVVIQCPN